MSLASVTTATSGLDTTAYDRMAYFALRAELFYDRVADVQPTNQTHRGAVVSFRKFADLAVASTEIDESNDITPVSWTESAPTVTLREYGNAVKTSAKLRGTGYLEVDPIAANLIGFNAGISIDYVAMGVLQAGSNVRYASGGTTAPSARNTVEPNDKLNARDVRRARVDLAKANVPTLGGYYIAYIHPDVGLDLSEETGAAAWRDPHTYSQPENIWNGELGAFERFRFMETPRAPLFADAGSSTTLTDVYATLFLGAQALAKAYSIGDGNGPFPKVMDIPVTDSLRRFEGVSWYWLGGYGRFREEALRRVESASTVGDNT